MTGSEDRRFQRAVWKDGRVLAGLAVVTVFLLCFGAAFHDVEATETAESDRFVEKAQQLRDGELPRDPYRPLLYPLLSAAAGALLGDSFAGARLVSQVAAIALLLGIMVLGQQCFGRSTGLIAAALLATNVFFLEHAVVTATDMLFCAGLVWCLVASIAGLKAPTLGRTLLIAGAFALATFTRFASLGLLPGVLVGLWIAPGGARRGAGRVALFLAAAAVFLIPHFVLTERAFGEPFHQQNLQNLLGKLYGGADASTASGGIALDRVAHDPGPLAASAWNLARHFVAFDFGYLAANRSDLLAPLYCGMLFLGGFVTLWTLDRRRAVLLIAFAGSLATVFLSKLSMPRTLLPTLPLALLFIAHFLTAVRWPASARIDQGRTEAAGTGPAAGRWGGARVGVAGLGLLLLLQIVAGLPAVADFVRRHPHSEIEAARWLEQTFGEGISVAGTYAHLDRHTNLECHPLPAPGPEQSAEEYARRLHERCRERDVEFFVVGPVSLRAPLETAWPAELLGLRAVHREGEAVVFRRDVVRP